MVRTTSSMRDKGWDSNSWVNNVTRSDGVSLFAIRRICTEKFAGEYTGCEMGELDKSSPYRGGGTALPSSIMSDRAWGSSLSDDMRN